MNRQITGLRQDQVNLLVYGPDRLYFKQKQKNNLTAFWPAGFFLILFFSAFLKKKKEIQHNKLL